MENERKTDLIDWTRPVEVIVDGGDPEPAEVVTTTHDDELAHVCFGPGRAFQRRYLVKCASDGTVAPVIVRNVAAFDHHRPAKTRDGRDVSCICRLVPPIGDVALLYRVLGKVPTLGRYQADGRPAHGTGSDADTLVNVPQAAAQERGPTFDRTKPFRTKDGRAVRYVRDVSDRLTGGGCYFWARFDGSKGPIDDVMYGPNGKRCQKSEATDDLVNFKPETEAVAGRPTAAVWDPEKPTRTRDGRAARKVGRGRDHMYWFEVLLSEESGIWERRHVYADGRHSSVFDEHPDDLVNFDPASSAPGTETGLAGSTEA